MKKHLHSKSTLGMLHIKSAQLATNAIRNVLHDLEYDLTKDQLVAKRDYISGMIYMAHVQELFGRCDPYIDDTQDEVSDSIIDIHPLGMAEVLLNEMITTCIYHVHGKSNTKYKNKEKLHKKNINTLEAVLYNNFYDCLTVRCMKSAKLLITSIECLMLMRKVIDYDYQHALKWYIMAVNSFNLHCISK